MLDNISLVSSHYTCELKYLLFKHLRVMYHKTNSSANLKNKIQEKVIKLT